MAFAIDEEDLIRQGHVHDYAEIAALGHVTRARVTQLMNLRLLAPNIQEQLLDLPRTYSKGIFVGLRELQPVALVKDREKQKQEFIKLINRR
jgi:hypothetical protein